MRPISSSTRTSTATLYACIFSAPLELVQLMITKAFGHDPRKRCLLAITNDAGWTALHCAVYRYSDLAVLELLIREHPLALCTTDDEDDTPLQLAIVFDSPAPIISIFTDITNALTAGDYGALAARVHGDERTIRCNILPPATLALRTTIFLLPASTRSSRSNY